MTVKILAMGAVLAALTICAGCVSPAVASPEHGGRSARQQLAIAKAAREALKKPKIDALRGMKVWVDVACISRAGEVRQESEDEHFLKNLIVEALVESGVVVVEREKAQAILRASAAAIGTDTVARVWPHTYLPLMYYVSHTAHVKVHMYAYEAQDSQMITVDECEGTYSWTEWSFLGLGPFR